MSVKIIAVVSAKGGVGKTSICANLSAGMTRMGHTVLSIDLDPQNSLRLHFGVSPMHKEGMATASLASGEWRESISAGQCGGYVLPFGQIDEDERQDFEQLLRDEPDYLRLQIEKLDLPADAIVILDTPPGPSVYLKQALSTANITIIVVLPDAASYSTIPMIISLIKKYCIGRTDFIDYFYLINQIDRSRQLASDVTDVINLQMQGKRLGIIHQDQSIPEGLACNMDVLHYDQNSRGAHDFEKCAQSLQNIFDAQLSVA
jgi:cellulose synthase operon protein YhjQ